MVPHLPKSPPRIYQYPIADITPNLTKPPRQRGRGCRRELEMFPPALASAFPGVRRTFWFLIFRNPPRIDQYRIAGKIPKLTKPPRPSGRGGGSPRKLEFLRHVGSAPHLFLILLRRPSEVHASRVPGKLKFDLLGSNHRPTVYKTGALTAELRE